MRATSFLTGKQEPRPDLRSEACEGGKERMQFRSMHLGPFKNQRSGLALLVSRPVSAWRRPNVASRSSAATPRLPAGQPVQVKFGKTGVSPWEGDAEKALSCSCPDPYPLIRATFS